MSQDLQMRPCIRKDANLQARPHDIGVASAIKSVVVSKLGRAHLNQHLRSLLLISSTQAIMQHAQTETAIVPAG